MKKRVFFLLVAALIMPWAMKAQVNSAVHVDSTLTKCDSYTWSVTGATYTSDTIVTAVVGDTLYILDLTIKNSVTNIITTPIQGGCTYQWGDSTYNANGTYSQTFTSSLGCDSTVTITLMLSTSASVTYDVTACDQYSFKNQSYTASGTYNITDTTNANCDSLITLNLTIKSIEQKQYDTIVSACVSTEWGWGETTPELITVNGTVRTSAEYSMQSAATKRIFHPRTAERCYDSLVVVTFNIKSPGINKITENACDLYHYYFSIQTSDTTVVDTNLYYTFSKSDTIKFKHLATNGCDSILITNITINPSPVVTISGDLRVTPGSSCTLHVGSDQSNVRFTWHDGSHDTVLTINNVMDNLDVYCNGKNTTTGCDRTSYVTILTNKGIATADDNAISVYPNPTSAVVNISSDEVVKSVTVFSMNGQQMINAEGVSSVDLSALAKGTYVIRVDLESGKVATRTIVVTK